MPNPPTGTLVHLPQPDGSFIDAEIISTTDDGKVMVRPCSAGSSSAPIEAATPLLLVNTLPEDGVEDMTRLTHLHDAAIVHNLGHRLARRHIYTDVGQICIAVNPFSWETSTPLYKPALRRRYRRDDGAALPPHLFALAERTHRAVRPFNTSPLINLRSHC